MDGPCRFSGCTPERQGLLARGADLVRSPEHNGLGGKSRPARHGHPGPGLLTRSVKSPDPPGCTLMYLVYAKFCSASFRIYTFHNGQVS